MCRECLQHSHLPLLLFLRPSFVFNICKCKYKTRQTGFGGFFLFMRIFVVSKGESELTQVEMEGSMCTILMYGTHCVPVILVQYVAFWCNTLPSTGIIKNNQKANLCQPAKENNSRKKECFLLGITKMFWPFSPSM